MSLARTWRFSGGTHHATNRQSPASRPSVVGCNRREHNEGTVASEPASLQSTSTPPAGFRMPAEWEPHAATWLAWPHEESDWPGKLAAIPWLYAAMIRYLHRREPVHLLGNYLADESASREVLTKAGVDLRCVTSYVWRPARVWTRDSGPTFHLGPNGQIG